MSAKEAAGQMEQINQNLSSEPIEAGTTLTAGKVLPWVAGGALLALGGANVFLFDRVNVLQGKLAQVQQVQTASATEVQALHEADEMQQAVVQQRMAELNTNLEKGNKTVVASAQAAAQNAQRNAERLARQLAEEQKASDAQIAKALGEVKSVADAHTAKVTGLETSVGSVRDEVSKTKSTLDETIAALGTVRGDLGVQSGLIATNSKELAALRELGDRQYYEFTIRKGAGPAKMANMTVELKKADSKKNKFNIQIVADDKRVEKKDRTVNEPVQMYVGGMRQPYEIVVNQVQKDAISGYLAVPKVLQSRR
jgi:DNA repair exonuclease SbcCD ATPase subunit